MKANTAILLILLLILSSCSFSNKDKTVTIDQLISLYSTNDYITDYLVERGNLDSLMNEIEISFNSKNYETVNRLITENQSYFKKEDRSLIYIYQAVSFAKRGMYTEAYDVLSNNEIYENSLYEQMANWYLALSMMKTQNVSEAKKLLTSFANNPGHYKQEEAKALLRKML